MLSLGVFFFLCLFVVGIKPEKLYFASTSGSQAKAKASGLPPQDHFWITTKPLVRFHKKEFDEMLCKLDSAKYARAFQTKTNPILRINVHFSFRVSARTY